MRMPDYRTPEGISTTATHIAALNIAASAILNRSAVPEEIERIALVSYLLEIAHILANALSEANDPDPESRREGA